MAPLGKLGIFQDFMVADKERAPPGAGVEGMHHHRVCLRVSSIMADQMSPSAPSEEVISRR